ncbi:MAG TPA: hypothetical protein VFC79_00020 [Tissierellaceae bacterium]|nr:hypothetical protein [Tissierellaceae bacterium]
MATIWTTLYNVVNATIKISGVVIEEGNDQKIVFDEPLILEIYADDGFQFDEVSSNFTINGENDLGDGVYLGVTYEHDGWNENHTIFSYQFPYPWSSILIANISPVESESEAETIINKFVGAYNPTVSQLVDLSEVWYLESGESRYDILNNIIKLYVLPYDITTYKSEEPSPIRIGGQVLEIQSITISEQILTFNLGEVSIPAKYGNAYDYINSKCVAMIPHFPAIELDVARIIDRTVSIVLNVSIYTGEATCNIYSDDELIQSTVQTISVEIPLQNNIERNPIGTVNSLLLNDVEAPYIELIRNIPYNEVEGVGKNVSQVEVIGNLAGYVEVEKVHLETSASKREQEMITSQLRNGVIIQ